MKRALMLGVALTAAVLSGCEARIEQLTTAPPGAIAEVDADADRVRLTRGVAVALACTTQGVPCRGLTAEVDDPDVALARPAFQDDLVWNGQAGEASQEAVVIAGLREGETVVHLAWDDGSLDVVVSVEGR